MGALGTLVVLFLPLSLTFLFYGEGFCILVFEFTFWITETSMSVPLCVRAPCRKVIDRLMCISAAEGLESLPRGES